MGLWKSLEGQCQIEIVSADLGQTLMAIQNEDILLTDIRFADLLRMQANITRRQLPALRTLLHKRGEEFRLIHRNGVYWSVVTLRKRFVLVVGLLLILFLSILLPSRVLFVQVEGNKTIASRAIIETANKCGIHFFASRRAVRSEKMKNSLLNAIPQLQWAGVNTKGCTAVISVRERKEEAEKNNTQIASSIVAGRDGIVEEITVLSGMPLCKVGQSVKKGQVLISGYTDCGLLIKLQRSEGEVIGQTFRHIEAITPVVFQQRGQFNRKKINYMLRIGKNIINFSKDSGISESSCVKMYEENSVTLPGGFALPVALIKETYMYADLDRMYRQGEEFSWLQDASQNHLKKEMIAGEILQAKYSDQQDEEIYTLRGKYTCREMLGQIRYEEIVKDNGA